MTNSFASSGLLGGLCADAQIAKQFSAPAFIARMRAVETAWTRALMHVGAVDAAVGEAALEAISKPIATRAIGEGTQQDGVPVPALVKLMRAGVPDDVGAAIHSGLTSQDVVDTAMVLTLRDILEEMELRLDRIFARLDQLDRAFGANPLMARTRLQAALPTTVGHRVDVWRRGLSQKTRLSSLREALFHAQVGGAIGARDKPAQNTQDAAGFFAQELGLSLGPVWHCDRASMIDCGHWMSLVSGALGKIGQDIALMAQQGIGEVRLSGAGGSSAMPHKQNPVSAELLVALSRFVAAQQGLLAQAMVHEQERSGVAWTLEWLTLPAMCEATAAALAHGEKLLGQVEYLGTPD